MYETLHIQIEGALYIKPYWPYPVSLGLKAIPNSLPRIFFPTPRPVGGKKIFHIILVGSWFGDRPVPR